MNASLPPDDPLPIIDGDEPGQGCLYRAGSLFVSVLAYGCLAVAVYGATWMLLYTTYALWGWPS